MDGDETGERTAQTCMQRSMYDCDGVVAVCDVYTLERESNLFYLRLERDTEGNNRQHSVALSRSRHDITIHIYLYEIPR